MDIDPKSIKVSLHTTAPQAPGVSIDVPKVSWGDVPTVERIVSITYGNQVFVDRREFVNPDCVWGEGECIPNCPTCLELDVAYAERVAGAREERERIRAGVMEIYRVAPKAAESILRVIDDNPTKCGRAHGDMCCAKCDEHATPHRGCILR